MDGSLGGEPLWWPLEEKGSGKCGGSVAGIEISPDRITQCLAHTLLYNRLAGLTHDASGNYGILVICCDWWAQGGDVTPPMCVFVAHEQRSAMDRERGKL